MNSWQKRFYKENHGEILKSNKEYRDKNKEKLSLKSKKYYFLNREKAKASSSARYYKDPVSWGRRNRNSSLIKKFGISLQEIDLIIARQGNKCLICDREFSKFSRLTSPHVDHNHSTGMFRGVICGRCNVGLGHFEDSVGLLKSAVGYLEEFNHYFVLPEGLEIIGNDLVVMRRSDFEDLLGRIDHQNASEPCNPAAGMVEEGGWPPL
jgi:hypothetical protein